jgi:hypothetical protein
VSDYAKGRIAWGLCQRCGLRYLLRELVLDGYYPNIRVCKGCYDPPQPQERLAVVSDPVALWKPAVDTYSILPPILTGMVVNGDQVVLNWTSIDGPPVGADHVGGHGPYGSAGYVVMRSIDSGVTWQILATLMNTADEFGALAIETLTYTDTPPADVFNLLYQIRGFDINENAENG